MNDNVSEFLKKMGMKDNVKEPVNKMTFSKLVPLPSTNIILGKVGTGKSGLAYYLLDSLSIEHELLPVVVNLPQNKRSLIPEHWVIKDLEGVKHTENCIVLIDEGTTAIPAGSKLEEMIKGFNSLSRQRNQIIIFIFHSSRDVGSRILRGIYGAILLKEPSQRQILYGSKDKWMRDILTEAKAKFKSLEEIGEDTRAWTYVDTECPEFRGMVKNGLPAFWTVELSKAWAGIEVETGRASLFIEVEEILKGKRLENEPRPEAFAIEAEYLDGKLIAFNVADPIGSVIRERATLIAEVCRKYRQFSPEQLNNAKVIYGDYHARVEL